VIYPRPLPLVWLFPSRWMVVLTDGKKFCKHQSALVTSVCEALSNLVQHGFFWLFFLMPLFKHLLNFWHNLLINIANT
jgi:hypothetical protein